MCYFCENKPFKSINCPKHLQFYDEKQKIAVYLMDCDYHTLDGFTYIKVNYCPICGRKLEDTEK